MDPIYISIAALGLAAVAVGVTLSRKHNHVVEGLRAELDLALAENKRLIEEAQRREDELHAAKAKSDGTLQRIADDAVAAVEQKLKGYLPRVKKSAALDYARRLDAGDNGQRDFTDAQLSVAIEAAVSRAAAASTR